MRSRWTTPSSVCRATGAQPGSCLRLRSSTSLAVASVAIGVSLPLLTELKPSSGNWITFVLLGTSVALAQLFVVRTPGNKSYHTTGVFLIPAALLLPAGARRADRRRPASPGLAPQPDCLVHPVVQHLQLHARDARCVGECPRDPRRGRADRKRRRSLRARGPRCLRLLRRSQLGSDRAHAAPRSRPVDAAPLLLPALLHGARLRRPRRRRGDVLDVQPVADPVRDRPAAAHSPSPVRAAAPGGGARRSEDGALQRTSLLGRARRRSSAARSGSSARCR